MGGGQHFQSLPKSLPSHFRGRNEAWGQIPPPDWRAREVTKQLGRDGLGVWEVLGSDKPEPIRSFSGFASSWVCAFARASAWILRARQRIAAVHRVGARRSAKTDTCLGHQRVRTLGARQDETKVSNVTRSKRRR